MSDVIVGGEKLVSTNRAAELSGYSKDYIGQLCRGGKLECRRISGHWYIDETSLTQYKQGDPQAREETKGTKAAFGIKVGNVRDDTFTYDGIEYVATSRAAELTGYAQDYVGQLARNGEIKARKIGRRWFVGRDSLLEHKKHNDGLLASVQAHASGVHGSVPSTSEKAERMEVESESEETEIEIHKNVEPGDISFNVRYVPETDRPLVPKLSARNPIKKEYAPGDIDKVPVGYVGMQSTQVPRPTAVPIRKNVTTRYTNIGEASSRRDVVRANIDISKHDSVFSPIPIIEQRRSYLFGWGAFVTLLLLGAVFVTISYFLGVIPTFPNMRTDISSNTFIQSLNDSYGDLFPGFEVEYVAE